MAGTKYSSEGVGRRFQPYPEYKDSAIEWLGRIPAHWNTKRLKHIAPVSTERTFYQNNKGRYVALEHIESETGRLLTENVPEEVESTASIFKPGDVLFGKLRPYLNKVWLCNSSGACSTEFLVLRSNGEIDPAYLAYQLRSREFIRWIDSMTYGTKMPRANPEEVTSTRVAIGPFDDQIRIAAFLDRETAEIDALIAKKERLIELLQEKRTALITQAVTKGLDPNVPMKDSGVEWLGNIPAHLEAKRLKYLSTINDEALSEKTDPRFELIYIDIGGVDQYQGIVQREELVFENAPSRARRIVKDGDLILSTVRTYLRAIAPIKNPEPNLICSTGFAVIRPSAGLESEFAAYALRAVYFVDQVVANSVGVSYPAIDASKMSSFPISIPEIEEQRAIAAFLDRETERIDGLIKKIHEAIDRLKEYRATLISAAVTGKIDVHNLID